MLSTSVHVTNTVKIKAKLFSNYLDHSNGNTTQLTVLIKIVNYEPRLALCALLKLCEKSIDFIHHFIFHFSTTFLYYCHNKKKTEIAILWCVLISVL